MGSLALSNRKTVILPKCILVYLAFLSLTADDRRRKRLETGERPAICSTFQGPAVGRDDPNNNLMGAVDANDRRTVRRLGGRVWKGVGSGGEEGGASCLFLVDGV